MRADHHAPPEPPRVRGSGTDRLARRLPLDGVSLLLRLPEPLRRPPPPAPEGDGTQRDRRESARGLAGRPAFLCIAGLAVALSAYAVVEASCIQVVRVRIVTDRLPASVPSLRIAQITDLHLGLIHRTGKAREVAAIVAREHPDIFVSTGDLVDGQWTGSRGWPGSCGNPGAARKIRDPREPRILRGDRPFDRLHPEVGIHAPSGRIRDDRRRGPTRGSRRSRRGAVRTNGRSLGSRPPRGSPGRLFKVLLKHRPQLDPASGGNSTCSFRDIPMTGKSFRSASSPGWSTPSSRETIPYPGRDPAREPRHGNGGPPMRFLAPPGDHGRGYRPVQDGESRMRPGRLAPSNRAAGVQLPIIPIVAGWIAETPGTIRWDRGWSTTGLRLRRSRRSPNSSRPSPTTSTSRTPDSPSFGARSRKASRRERDRGPLRAQDLRDGRSEPGVPQRGPRELRPGTR